MIYCLITLQFRLLFPLFVFHYNPSVNDKKEIHNFESFIYVTQQRGNFFPCH